jgi:glycine dehydrogenase
VPADIRLPAPLALGEPTPEHVALARLKAIAGKNVVKKSLIGMGYYDTITPKVILRNVMENPGWYTAYTPYQAEISQGRLEALLNYQQMVIDLTGLELANASLLDEATAAAEAMAMARRISKLKGQAFFVDEGVFPQTLDVLRTRAGYFGFELIIGPAAEAAHHEVFGALLQYPDERGIVTDIAAPIAGSRPRARWWPSPPTCWPSCCSSRRANWAPTSPSARPSASACRWASAAPTPPSSPPAKPTCAPCRAASSASPRTPAARPPCA